MACWVLVSSPTQWRTGMVAGAHRLERLEQTRHFGRVPAQPGLRRPPQEPQPATRRLAYSLLTCRGPQTPAACHLTPSFASHGRRSQPPRRSRPHRRAHCRWLQPLPERRVPAAAGSVQDVARCCCCEGGQPNCCADHAPPPPPPPPPVCRRWTPVPGAGAPGPATCKCSGAPQAAAARRKP